MGFQRSLLALALPLAAIAQENAPIGILRGDLVAWVGSARTGELTFRNSDERLYQCSFDDKTYFERENQRISIAATQKGDRVEILSDRRIGSDVCYARTVQIIEPPTARVVPGVRPRLRQSISTTELFAPRGNMTFAGVVLRLDAERLVLRTRSGEHKRILLRSDTRYLTAGQAADRLALPINTRVFIRAGKNLDDDVEAYQIIWGDILQP
jgi:hypothetical protein